MTAADTWTDRYEGRAVCPAGHEFIAEWLDTKRADQTCPVCFVTFTATWRGFEIAPEVVVVEPGTAIVGAGVGEHDAA